MQTEQFELHASLEESHWWFLARRQIMRAIVQRCLPLQGQKEAPLVLDVGCGTGGNIASLADTYRCVGADTSAVGIQLAQKRYPQVSFVCGHAPAAVEAESQEADMWLFMDVLEHVPDDFEMLSTLLSAMRPGAQLLLTVPAHLHLWSVHDESFGHYRRYDHTRLQAVWADLPVRVRLLSYYNTHLYPIIRTIRAFQSWRGSALGSSETDFTQPSAPINRSLQAIFAAERKRLVAHVDRAFAPGKMAYPTGVSLIAVLERLPGTVEPRTRPARFGPDFHQPA